MKMCVDFFKTMFRNAPSPFSAAVTTTEVPVSVQNIPCGPECWPAPFGKPLTVFIAISLAICIVITTFGNLLVLVSFVVDRQIRQPTNFFIAR